MSSAIDTLKMTRYAELADAAAADAEAWSQLAAEAEAAGNEADAVLHAANATSATERALDIMRQAERFATLIP